MSKKVLSLLFSLIMVFAVTSATHAFSDETEILTPGGYSIGDVNMDKSVNVKDATAVQKHIAGIVTLGDSALILADTDLNGYVNIKDATYIQKQVAGLVPPAGFYNPTTPATTETSAEVTSSAPVTTAPASEESTASTPSSTASTTAPTESDEGSVVVTSTAATEETLAPEVPAETSTTTPAETSTTTPAETSTTAPTEPPTRDPDKPIELPFIPAA